MQNTFELKPCVGVIVGTERDPEPQTITWDQDEIWCNGRRAGHVSHYEGAVCRMQRVLAELAKKEVYDAVSKLRADLGKPPIGERVVCLPEPSTIKGALTSAKRKR